MFYRVTIEKKRFTDPFDKMTGSYHWQVECYKDKKEDTRQEWELRGGGYTRSAAGAKKKALKHLLGVEKDIQEGLKFGVMFDMGGTAKQMEKELTK